MICGCNRSQVCATHLKVVCFMFRRRRHFKCLITVISKPSWGVWFIPQTQIARTDFRFQSLSLTWSLFPNNRVPWGFIKFTFAPLGDYLCCRLQLFLVEYSEQGRELWESLFEECRAQKYDPPPTIAFDMWFIFMVCARAIGIRNNVSTWFIPHIWDLLLHPNWYCGWWIFLS